MLQPVVITFACGDKRHYGKANDPMSLFLSSNANKEACHECRGKPPSAPPPQLYAFMGSCCMKATVSGGCVCAYVTDCAEHGQHHWGTHE
jgi:hypothetical protein